MQIFHTLSTFSLLRQRFARWFLVATAVAVLSACGGGGSGVPAPDSGSADTISTTPSTSTQTAATPTPAPAPAPAPPSGGVAPSTLEAAKTCNIGNFAQDLLARMNAVRASGTTCGTKAAPAVAAVAWNTALFEAAAVHSADMAARGYFDHTSPEGSTVGTRVTAQGYTWRFVGENIAAGQRSMDSVMNSWLTSPGHCENIMRASAQEVGLACVLKANDPQRYSYYWTMVVAAPR